MIETFQDPRPNIVKHKSHREHPLASERQSGFLEGPWQTVLEKFGRRLRAVLYDYHIFGRF